MILAVDVGGTKTLIGLFNNQGDLKKKQRLITNANYSDFVQTLANEVSRFTQTEDISKICIAMPGRINRTTKSVIAFGHRPWKNAAIARDLAAKLKFDEKNILIENDANLAGLAEAKLHKQQQVVVYVTISTGVGSAIITDGQLNPYFLDSEVGQTLLESVGKLHRWDDFESGSSIAEHYHKLASEIDDPDTWNVISRHLAGGFSGIIGLLQPNLVIVGGSVGVQLAKFEKPLLKHLSAMEQPLITMPTFRAASHGEDSVLYGCYQLASQSI